MKPHCDKLLLTRRRLLRHLRHHLLHSTATLHRKFTVFVFMFTMIEWANFRKNTLHHSVNTLVNSYTISLLASNNMEIDMSMSSSTLLLHPLHLHRHRLRLR